MSSKQQCVNLNDGHVIPVLGFGTYAPEEVTILGLALETHSRMFMGGSNCSQGRALS